MQAYGQVKLDEKASLLIAKTLALPFDCDEASVEIEYKMHGCHMPATFFEAEEFPECEIEQVTITELYHVDGQFLLEPLQQTKLEKIAGYIFDFDKLETMCFEQHEENNYDD